MDKQKLIREAIRVLPKSYVPYSHFHVAAALLCKDQSIYTKLRNTPLIWAMPFIWD